MRKNHQLLKKIRKTKVSIISAIQIKPPVLDIKWENHDINVAARANILKFSKLDDIVTPLRLLELFFDDVLVDMIVGYAKL